MDIRTIRNLSDADLTDAIDDKREEIFRLRFQKAAQQVKDTNLLKAARHDLAQMLTIVRERQLAAGLAAEGVSDGE